MATAENPELTDGLAPTYGVELSRGPRDRRHLHCLGPRHGPGGGSAACAGLAAWGGCGPLPVRRRVPDRHDVVRAGGGKAPAVGAEGHSDAQLVPQGQEFLAGERVPYL